MTLPDVVVTGNHTPDGLAGLPNAGSGGGIVNSGSLTLINCVVSGNSTGGGPARGGDGGGIFVGQFGATLINTTVSGNSTGAGGGGGVFSTFGSLTLTNSTVTANSGLGVSYSGDPSNPSQSATVRNTIIAGNGSGGSGPDVSGAFSSQGHNLIGNVGTATGFNAAGDMAGTSASLINPRLGPLADNGGPTRTHALLAGSPALDAGDNSLAKDANNNPLTTDQRGAGFARFADSADADTTQTVDIGAFEAHPTVEDIADKTVSLPVVNDSTPEQNETLALSLSAFGGATGAHPNATLTINDNDASVSPVSGSGVYAGTATLTATLTAGGSPLAGKSVGFTLGGSPVGSATTDASGVATLTGVSLSGISPGTDAGVVGAAFAGDANFTGGSGTATLSVSKAGQSITFDALGNKIYGDPDFSVSASASSGLAVSFSTAELHRERLDRTHHRHPRLHDHGVAAGRLELQRGV
jgi:hypothetical protein